MSREQVQIPIGGKGEESEQEKSSAPKGLNRPAMPTGLEKPRPMAKKIVLLRRKCNGCTDWTCRQPTPHDSLYVWEYFDEKGDRIFDSSLPLHGRDWPEGFAPL